jgi:hypothetical protein
MLKATRIKKETILANLISDNFIRQPGRTTLRLNPLSSKQTIEPVSLVKLIFGASSIIDRPLSLHCTDHIKKNYDAALFQSIMELNFPLTNIEN